MCVFCVCVCVCVAGVPSVLSNNTITSIHSNLIITRSEFHAVQAV